MLCWVLRATTLLKKGCGPIPTKAESGAQKKEEVSNRFVPTIFRKLSLFYCWCVEKQLFTLLSLRGRFSSNLTVDRIKINPHLHSSGTMSLQQASPHVQNSLQIQKINAFFDFQTQLHLHCWFFVFVKIKENCLSLFWTKKNLFSNSESGFWFSHSIATILLSDFKIQKNYVRQTVSYILCNQNLFLIQCVYRNEWRGGKKIKTCH